MTRVADALTGPHARAALVTNPRGATYHKAYAGGIAGGMNLATAPMPLSTAHPRPASCGIFRTASIGQCSNCVPMFSIVKAAIPRAWRRASGSPGKA